MMMLTDISRRMRPMLYLTLRPEKKYIKKSIYLLSEHLPRNMVGQMCPSHTDNICWAGVQVHFPPQGRQDTLLPRISPD